MRFDNKIDTPVLPAEDTFLATLDADTVALLVFTMIISWALAQLALILWKKVREIRRKRDESDTDTDHDNSDLRYRSRR